MAITSLNVVPITAGHYRLNWTSSLTSPTFYVYVNGVLAWTTRQSGRVVRIDANASPLFEVLDDPAAVPTSAYPAFATLFWYAVAGAASYRIEQNTGSWAAVATVKSSPSAGSYVWQSPPQPDGSTALFRVIPVGANGNDGTAINFSILIARHPDPPSVIYAYNAGTGMVSIS